MNKKTRIKLLVSLCISFALAGLILLFINSRTYQILEFKALDLRFTLKGSRVSTAPIVHIDIDDQSLSALGRWPWPRSYHAKMVSILKECQARQVLMDVIFTEEFKDKPQEDQLFAEAIEKSGMVYLPFYFDKDRPEVYPQLRSLLLKDITITSEAAAKALGVTPEILQEKFPQAKKALMDEIEYEIVRVDPGITSEAMLQRIEEQRGWFLFAEDESYLSDRLSRHKLSRYFINKFGIGLASGNWLFKQESGLLNVPIRAYAERIKGSGFINADPDLDGVTRKVPLFVRYEDKILPQLTVAALMDFLQVKKIETDKDRIIFKQAVINGHSRDISIPVDQNGRMLVNWHGKWGQSFKHLPYYLILKLQELREQLSSELNSSAGDAAGEQKKTVAVAYLKKSEAELMQKLSAMVKGKICIVGLTATGTHDFRPIPLQENYPMVGTHSNLISTILSENFIVKKEGWLRILIFFFTALLIGASCLIKMWKSLILVTAYVVGYFLISLYLFVNFGVWIDLVGPMGIAVFGFSSITTYRFFTEEKEKLWIKQAFSHYLSNEVISELIEDPSRLKLGGERRMITVIFSDVRGFTSFSESHQPEEVVAMLNEILSQQVKVVFKYNGTLDKFVGDELMAFFGAPGNQHLNDHALVAVRVAVEIQQRMVELRQKWTQEKKDHLQIGIGINTGEMVVGNMGSAERMDYTIIGDNVNLGARLCSVAGKDEIIISQATYELAAEHIIAEKLEPISVKGKAKPISIYRVTGMK